MNLQLEWDALRRQLRTREASDRVQVHDEIHLDLALLPVLDEARLWALLREVLRDRGWTEQPDGALTRAFGDASAVLAPDARSVVLRREREAEVKVTAELEVDPGSSERGVEKQLAREARRALRDATERERARLEAQNVGALTAAEPDLRAAVQDALNRTYRRALEERARALGDVESVREQGDPGGSYEVTVVVRA